MRRSASLLMLALALADALCAGAALADGTDALGGPPPFTLERAHSYYPPAAKQRGLTGRVGLTCSIDAHGHARSITIVESAGKLFDAAARQLLTDERFEPPADWTAKRGPERTYAFGVIFELADKPKVAPFADDRPIIVVSARPPPSA